MVSVTVWAKQAGEEQRDGVMGLYITSEDGTKEQYEASVAAVHPNERQPARRVRCFMRLGLPADGWTIIAVPRLAAELGANSVMRVLTPKGWPEGIERRLYGATARDDVRGLQARRTS